jgi:hypothetical protein
VREKRKKIEEGIVSPSMLEVYFPPTVSPLSLFVFFLFFHIKGEQLVYFLSPKKMKKTKKEMVVAAKVLEQGPQTQFDLWAT